MHYPDRRFWAARLGLAVLLAAEIYMSLVGAALTEDAETPSDGRLRILCLGESTTGPIYPLDISWPAQLQDLFDKTLGRGAVSVINEGKLATNTNIIMAELPDLLDRYHPQVVVAMMGANDDQWYGVASERGRLASAFRSLRVVRAARGLLHEYAEAWMDWRRPAEDPRWTKALNEARVLSRSGRFLEARRALVPILKAPEMSGHLLELSLAFRLFGDPRAAAQSERLAADAGRSLPAYQLEWARLDMERRNREAETLARGVLRHSPEDRTARLLWGRSLLAEGLYDQAASAFEAVLAEAPKDWPGRWEPRQLLMITDLRANRLAEASRNEDLFLRDLAAADHRPVHSSPMENWWQSSFLTSELDAGQTGAAERRLERLAGASSVAFTKLTPAEVTRRNELRLAELLRKRGIRFLAMQYPLRDPAPLEKLFGPGSGVSIIGNKDNFEEALRSLPREALFLDGIAGDFGHCTARGNELISINVARQLSRLAAIPVGNSKAGASQ